MHNPLDYFVVFLYFAIIIYIGKRASDQVKRESEYLLATKKLGRFPTALSLAASDMGGSGLVGTIALVYMVGISGGWWDFLAVPAFIVLGYTLVPALKRLNIRSVPEFFEKRYCIEIRIIAAVLHLIGLTLIICVQTIVASIVITTLTGIPEFYTVLVATAVFLVYTARGGLPAVVWTDVWGYLVFMSSILISLPFAIVKAGGIDNIVATVPHYFWKMSVLGWMEPIAWIAMGFYMYITNQYFIQRIVAAKDIKTARFAYFYTGINYLFYGIIVGLLGICIAVIEPWMADPKMAVTIIMGKVLPTGLSGFFMAGILAATMSTSSSYLNAGASIFTIDIYKRLINPQANEVQGLRVARVSTCVIAGLSLIISFYMNNLINGVVLAQIVFSASVFFPFILGLRQNFLNSAGALSAIIGGAIAAIFSYFFLYQKESGFFGSFHPVFVSSVTSLFILILVSLVFQSRPINIVLKGHKFFRNM